MKKPVVVLLHVAYWLLYFMLLLIILLAINASKQKALSFPRIMHGFFFEPFFYSMIINPALGFYSFYLFLFPKFLKPGKIFALVLYGLLFTFVSSVLIAAVMSLAIDPKYLFAAGWDSAISITIAMAFLALIHGVIALVIKGFISWYADIKLKEELSNKNYEMELALVKSQINPHFLFNTINNIDVLIEKNAAKASAYLNKLSDIMRFMLYETKTGKVYLSKELAYIEKYLDLQKIRSSNPAYVSYTVEGSAADFMIEPMIFLPFIENAFKHAGNKKSGNSISVRFLVEKDKVTFNCENHYVENHQVKMDHSGLGNGLIKKRLMLLYPGKHTLEINNEDGIYKVKLTINRHED